MKNKRKRSIRLRHLGLLLLVFSAGLLMMGSLDESTRDALKVQDLLKTIEKAGQQADSKPLTAEVSEKEVNAYIAYRLANEKDSVVNSLTVGLLDNNQVQGKIRFDGDRLSFGRLFGDSLTFDFQGIIHTRNQAARLDLTTLSLGGYAVDPKVLDVVLNSAGTLYKTDVGRVGDWYALPKGIKRVTVQKAKAIIYY